MGDKKHWSWTAIMVGLAIGATVLLLPKMVGYIKTVSISPNVEGVRKKMGNHLYEKYGEEFVVDRIGTQSINERTNYVARIYPKSIVGTEKEGDSYYYAKAGAEKKAFGGVGEVGDGYEIVKLNMEAEEYLKPKVKDIFGNRVKLKVDVKYKKRKEGNDYFSWKIVDGFRDLLQRVKSNPEKHRIELELYMYIFDRIDDKTEKEKRREQIFEFVQYLKDKSLFNYLKVGVAFIDERVLAPNYDKFSRKVYLSDKMKKEVEGETVYLPPLELRKKMSRELQEEIDKTSEEKLLVNMRKIRKSKLTYDGIREYNGQYYCWIYSPKMRRLKYNVGKNEVLKQYKTIKDIQLEQYDKYMFLN